MAKKAPKNELFFIKIPDPKTVRKNLLEASQHVVEGMKSYEKYKKIKAQKLQKLHNLKKTFEEIKVVAGQLRACLPTIKGVPEAVQEKKMPHIAEIELEQLDKEIQKLEEELRLLT